MGESSLASKKSPKRPLLPSVTVYRVGEPKDEDLVVFMWDADSPPKPLEKVETDNHGGDEDEDALASLSAAEREVLTLVERGMSNADIAKERGTALRTVANQVASLLKKLNLGSRYEIIARSRG